jgi:hypothetical protein
MDRRRYATALRDDDRRSHRRWTVAVVVFYAVVLGVLGSAAWLGAKPSGRDLGQPAMAGRIVSPHVALAPASAASRMP